MEWQQSMFLACNVIIKYASYASLKPACIELPEVGKLAYTLLLLGLNLEV